MGKVCVCASVCVTAKDRFQTKLGLYCYKYRGEEGRGVGERGEEGGRGGMRGLQAGP